MKAILKGLKYALIIASIAQVVVITLLTCRSSVKSQVNAVYEGDMNRLKDSVRVLKLKNGQLVAENQAYLLSEEQLTKDLSLTRKEVVELKGKLRSSIRALSEIKTQVRVDTLKLPGKVIYQSTDSIDAEFDYGDKWMDLAGQVNIRPNLVEATLYKMNMKIPLVVGMTEDNRVFATSPNPYITITDIQSNIVYKKPKRKHWGVGLNVGPGVYYDAINNKFAAGIGLQVGLNYNF